MAPNDPIATETPRRPAAELFAELRAKNAARRVRAAELTAAGGSIRMVDRDGRLILVGPDVAQPGQFRITYFDAGVPTGHTEHDTFGAAVLEALIYGFEPITKGSSVNSERQIPPEAPSLEPF